MNFQERLNFNYCNFATLSIAHLLDLKQYFDVQYDFEMQMLSYDWKMGENDFIATILL